MANPIRRKLKNVINNYTDAQVKVREATSNDPWGPSSTLMSEVADLSYNVVAFSEVMQMIWKRLNDSGKNWRHVYKALVLLDYILKTGSEKVAQQCRENIYAIQTLQDFQYMEDNKDQGINVREKAKQLVILLKDEEKLKQERAKALKAKERLAQNRTSISSTGGMQQSASMTFTRHHSGGSAPSLSGADDTQAEGGRRSSMSDLEQARPSTVGEEELQLQLALAISKEEAEQDTQKKRGDDVRLAMALQESQKLHGEETKKKKTLVDILGEAQPVPPARNHAGDFWSGGAAATNVNNDPWSAPHPAQDAFSAPQNDPWAPASKSDPWSGDVGSTPTAQNDPWSATPTQPTNATPWPGHGPSQEDDDFDALMGRPTQSPPTVTDNGILTLSSHPPTDHSETDDRLDLTNRHKTRTPQDFLGANSSLVNLDNLVGSSGGSNPFTPGAAGSNPFMAQTAPRPTLNQMQYQARADLIRPGMVGQPGPQFNQPLIPSQPSQNPFM